MKNRLEKTANTKFLELCDEIDYWKEVADKEKQEAQYWKKEYDDLMNGQLKHNKQMVGTILTGMLNGNIKSNE